MSKGRKFKERLLARIKSYEESIRRMTDAQRRGYRRPGSQSGRKS